jgi:hypothetical protein
MHCLILFEALVSQLVGGFWLAEADHLISLSTCLRQAHFVRGAWLRLHNSDFHGALSLRTDATHSLSIAISITDATDYFCVSSTSGLQMSIFALDVTPPQWLS